MYFYIYFDKRAIAWIISLIPRSRLKVASNAVNKLSELFRAMEYGVERGFWTDWGVEKESLENVFLSVVEDDIIFV